MLTLRKVHASHTLWTGTLKDRDEVIDDRFASVMGLFVYYESIKRELQMKPMYECRCAGRLQTKTEGFTRLSYAGLVVELEHLKIKTRLIDEEFASAMGEYLYW